jgi:hypothetical protein
MPIPLGILAAAGRSQAPAGAFQLLESTVLTGSQASVEFTNLATKYASTYQHLQIRATVRDSNAGNLQLGTFMQFNGVTTNSYSWHWLYGAGSGSPTSQGFPTTNRILVGIEPTNGTTANAFGTHVFDVLDAFSSTKNKTTRSLSGNANAGGNFILLSSGAFYSTSAVTSIKLFPEGGSDSFVQFSRFSLYGIRATA